MGGGSIATAELFRLTGTASHLLSSLSWLSSAEPATACGDCLRLLALLSPEHLARLSLLREALCALGGVLTPELAARAAEHGDTSCSEATAAAAAALASLDALEGRATALSAEADVLVGQLHVRAITAAGTSLIRGPRPWAGFLSGLIGARDTNAAYINHGGYSCSSTNSGYIHHCGNSYPGRARKAQGQRAAAPPAVPAGPSRRDFSCGRGAGRAPRCRARHAAPRGRPASWLKVAPNYYTMMLHYNTDMLFSYATTLLPRWRGS